MTTLPALSGTVSIEDTAMLEIAELAPGATLERRWRIHVATEVDSFGVETVVEGVGIMPTMAYRRLGGAWRVPTVTAVDEAALVPEALAIMAPRQLRKGNVVHADVRVGRTATHLLLALDIVDAEVKPDLSHPWAGSCVEVYAASAQPAEPKLQLFLVPEPTTGTLHICRIVQQSVVPMAEADGLLRLGARGYACAARIPLNQFPAQAADMRCELRVLGRPEADQPRTATSLFGSSNPTYSTADYGVIQFDAGKDGGIPDVRFI